MCRRRRLRWEVISLRSSIATAPRQVMSGMERQIAELSGREESTTSLARESKQKAREIRFVCGADSRKTAHHGREFSMLRLLPLLI